MKDDNQIFTVPRIINVWVISANLLLCDFYPSGTVCEGISGFLLSRAVGT